MLMGNQYQELRPFFPSGAPLWFSLGIFREPAAFYAFFLFLQLENAPHAAAAEHSKDDGSDQGLHEKRSQQKRASGGKKARPAAR